VDAEEGEEAVKEEGRSIEDPRVRSIEVFVQNGK